MRTWFAIALLCIAGTIVASETRAGLDRSSPERELTLYHPRPESRSHWRIPQAYLDWLQDRGQELPHFIRVAVALPDLRPCAGRCRVDDDDGRDSKRLITVNLKASYDFALEKRIIPDVLRRAEFERDHDFGLLEYRPVYRDREGRIVRTLPPPSGTLFFPKTQIPGRAIYLLCEVRCRASIDFSETIVGDYSFDRTLLRDWRVLDERIRGLIAEFLVN